MDEPHNFNILITGTPATGKTTLAQMVAEELGMEHLEIGELVKQHAFHSGRDETFDTLLIEEEDEDRLLDFMEPLMVAGGKIVDYHSSEFFPRRWFHAVLVLRTATETHFDRLTARRYNEAKQNENREAEICGVCEEEARDSYDETIVFARPNNTLEEMVDTVEFVRGLHESWTAANQAH